MKKFYLFFVALVVSVFAASAADQYAIHGQILGNLSWGPTALEDAGDGIWTLKGATLNKGEFGIRVYEGSVDSQKNWWSAPKGKNTVNAAGEYEVATSEFENFTSNLEGKYDITLNVNTMKISFKAAAVEPGPAPEFPELYVRGTMTNNFAAVEDWKMTTTDGENYVLENKSVEKDAEFKIADKEWGEYNFGANGANQTIEFGKAAAAVSGNDSKDFVIPAASEDVTFKFTLSTKSVTVINNKEVVEPDPTPGEEKEYTIYFYGQDGVSAYIWSDNVEHVGKWEESLTNGKLQATDYKYKGNTVYTITVKNEVAPDKLIFRMNNGNSQTGNLDWKNNALYTTDGSYVVDYTWDVPEVFTYYIAGTIFGGNWEPVALEQKGDVYVITGKVAKEEQFKLIRRSNVNGDTFIGANATGESYWMTDNTPSISMNVGGGKDIVAKVDGTYTLTFNPADNTLAVVKEQVAADMATVYLSLGADYMLDNNKKAPVATFKGNDVADYIVTMTEADEEYIFLAEFDKNKYSSVSFNVNGVDYPMDSDIAKEHNNELEGDGWYKYIYCTDGDSDDNKWSTQSYLTRDRYVELRDSERTGYCVAGSHDAWNLTNEANRKPMTGGICSFASSEMAVGTKFKISYIDPIALNANAADKVQRWWATFNLGIVGPDPYGADVVQDGTNKYVPYNVRVPKKYNHYCKYDWCVSEAGTYYVVIDPEHEVTVLLTFAPSPTLETATNGVYSKSATENEELVSLPFEQHGVAQVREFNISEGTAEITRSSSPDAFREEYDVVYYLEADGKVIHKYSDLFENGELTEIVDITGIVSSDMSELSFYAQYTCNGIGDSNEGEGVVFNSRKTSVEVKTGEVTFDALEAAETPAGFCLVANGTTAEGLMNWDAVFAVSYDYIEGDFAWYPAFGEVSCNGIEAELVHAGHPVLSRKVSGITFDEGALYEKADDFSAYNHTTHSWAEVARRAKKFYFYAENVAQTATRAEASDVELSFDGLLKAIYPFSTKLQSETPKARVAAIAADQLFTFLSADSNFHYAVKANNNLTSGVSDVELGEAEGEVELYNLQGVRVEGEAAPGLYIRRQGNKVEKIQIR